MGFARQETAAPSVDPELLDPEVGLCSGCGHAAAQASARGSTFWRCQRAESDARFRRYPPLPVLECPGFAPRPSETR